MSQNFTPPFAGSATLSATRSPINDAFDALQTHFLGAADPTSVLEDGMIWVNTSGTPKLKGRQGGATFEIGDWNVSNLGHLRKDGTIPLTANWNVNNFKVTGLATPTSGTDAATKTYADLKVAKAGDTMTGTLILNLGGAGDPIQQYAIPSGSTVTAGLDDSDSDKYRVQFASSLGGDAGLTLTSTGRLGIGNAAPATTLHVKTTDNIAGTIESSHTTRAEFTIKSTDTATGGARVNINAELGSTGDPSLMFQGGAASGNFCLGLDSSDSDKFKLCLGTVIGTSNCLIFNSSREFIMSTRNTVPADADIPSGMSAIWVDEGANTLKFRIRKTDGTYRTATISTT